MTLRSAARPLLKLIGVCNVRPVCTVFANYPSVPDFADL